jgi:hypothetical protein
MKTILVVGLMLVVLGLVALAVPSFTYFTTDRVADVGFFKIAVSRPHTVVLNPIVGGASATEQHTIVRVRTCDPI